jgi:hypothetical protein
VTRAEQLLQARVASLAAQRAAMVRAVAASYDGGAWAKASPADRARTRSHFRVINRQLRRAVAELTARQGR